MQKEVSIYTTPVCTYCKMAKEFFKDNGIAYAEYNVATDVDRRTEMVNISGQMGVPVITIGNDLIVGFNKPKVAELLDIKL